MASAAKSFSRAFARQASAGLRTSSGRLATPSQAAFRAGSRRAYSSQPPKQARSTGLLVGAAVLALGGAGAAYYVREGGDVSTKKTFTPTQADYQKVYDAIAKELVEKDNYDDGSYGPVSTSSGNFCLARRCGIWG
jgi:cytochrome c peroxidase